MTTYLPEPATEGPASEILEITLRFEGDRTVCALAGRLCAETARSLDGWLDQLRDNGLLDVVVDASDVVTMTSDGVAVLARHAAGVRVAGGTLLVRDPRRGALRVLDRCRALHLVE